jgi:AraC-like DNA-binding protein
MSTNHRHVLGPMPPVLRARVEAARPLVQRLGVAHPLVRGLGLHDESPALGRQLPVAALDALWDALIEREGPAVPLLLANGVRASSYGLLTYLLGCAPSGQHALRRLGSGYRELLSEGTCYEIAIDRRHVEVGVELQGPGRSDGASLFAIASVVGFMAGEVEGGPRPLHVQLAVGAPPPRSAEAFSRFFAGPVRYGVERSRLVYERAVLDRRLQGSDPVLAEILEEAVRQRQPPPRPTAHALREVLLAAGPAVAVSLVEAAALLGLGPRSLRRRLTEEGSGFQAVLDDVRRCWAEAWLAVPHTRVAELAPRLGYADAAAFRRAFRRWTGTSPAAWAAVARRGQLPGTTPVSTSATPSTSASSTVTATQLSTPSPTKSA